MQVVAIIQARTGSTRLPGKVLKKVFNKTLLEYQIERVRRAKTIDQIVIATTTNKADDQIIQLCDQMAIPYFRGSEEDVLSRYYEAATTFQVETIVRLTSDCPIIDPNVIDQVVSYFLSNNKEYDYVSNTLKRTFPRGMDTEVFSYRVLEQTHKEAKKQEFREHVTAYIYQHPNIFKLGNVQYSFDASHYRWTVDTFEDFQLISKIIKSLYPSNPKFTLTNVFQILEENPDWNHLNAHIKQKKV